MKEELKPHQQTVLDEIYRYKDKAHFSEEELEMAKKMFDEPEKFALLRKILQVFTPEERGLTIPGPQAFIDTDVKDLQGYALATYAHHLADEKVRQALNSFYMILRGHIVDERKKEFEEENQKEFEEQKRTEKFKEEQEDLKKKFGDNL